MLLEEALETIRKAVEDTGYIHHCYSCKASWWSKRANTGACHKCGSWVVGSTPASHDMCIALEIETHPEG
jgi:hypothetical protein